MTAPQTFIKAGEVAPDAARVTRVTGRKRRIVIWGGGVALLLLAALYLRLLAGPMPLPFVSGQAQNMVRGALPENYDIALGASALALEDGYRPVIQFSPVTLTDKASGAVIGMEALELGFSPIPTLVGQPGARIIMIKPKIQVIQDLFGPRPASFELIEGDEPGDAMIRITNGAESLPPVRISSGGINVDGSPPDDPNFRFRSDNEWLITNLVAAEHGIAGFSDQAAIGRIARFEVRDGTVQMHDVVYGLYREFTDIEYTLRKRSDKETEGRFEATLAGQRISGSLDRIAGPDGTTRLTADVENLDFASIMPFLDDADGAFAIKGAGALKMDVNFLENGTKVGPTRFNIDLNGTNLRMHTDLFPVKTSNIDIAWEPDAARFTLEGGHLEIGKSSSELSGTFVLGLDERYGPTIGMSIEARDLALNPEDMAETTEPFTSVKLEGWSAPLYGAIGIDHLVAVKPGTVLRTSGRVDMLRSGMGMTLSVIGAGASADDLKRVWPYFVSTSARDWFVRNVTAGTVDEGSMELDFPVGSIVVGEEQPVPPGALKIDLVGLGVDFRPVDEMDVISVAGKSYVEVRDNQTTLRIDGARIANAGGEIDVGSAAFIIDFEPNNSAIFEISGDIAAPIPALLEMARRRAPDLLDNASLPIDLGALSGSVQSQIVATIVADRQSNIQSLDYALNGTISDFASSEPIENYDITNGQLNFRAAPDDFGISGTADVQGIPTEVQLRDSPEIDLETVIAATLSIEELKTLGFDATEFLDGNIRFAAKLLPDGPIQVTADLEDTSVTVADLGLTKVRGVPGMLNAEVLQDGSIVDISSVSVEFGDVDLNGSLLIDPENGGLQRAEFSSFALSEGDSARALLEPIEGGVKLTLRGEQFDLKPMLKRYYALDQASTGGPQSTQFDQTIAIDAELDRAVGFYRTTAFGFDLDMSLRGENLRNVSLQAQFGEGNSISVTTNQVPNGRTLSVAFNDAGTVLRFLNVYSRLAGGSGTIVMTTDGDAGTDSGELQLFGFQLIDEAKVTEILGNHSDSRELLSERNSLSFNRGKVNFVRRSDRIEVTEALLDGGTVGGTLRGFVYTKERRYDLAGTYVPLFGINSIFQKLPIIGEVIGGRDGEGLVGVTFAIRGDLDAPQFLVNPVSILVPGAFRALFEYRAKEAPREE